MEEQTTERPQRNDAASEAEQTVAPHPEDKDKTPSPEEPALEKELTPQQLTELKKKRLLAQLEEEGQESPLGHLFRSKNFWYAVFGVLFFAIMGGIILWTARDLGYL